MSTPISSIGVGSGLPLNELLEDLRKAENAPLAALQTRADKESARFSAYGTLKSAIDAVSTAASALGKGETFHAIKANVTGDTFTATVEAGSGAIAGKHSITVNRLATAQVMASGQASVEAGNKSVVEGATGTVNLNFTVGTGDGATNHTLSVDANASLQDIAKAITDDADLNFSATLMNDGEGFRLIISSNETGAANTLTAISVVRPDGDTGTGDISGLQDILDYEAGSVNESGMKATIEGRNAEATINGIKVTSQSNELKGAIQGVTLTLNKEAAEGAQSDSLQLSRNDSVATTAVNNFVSAYNALQSTIKSLTSYDVDAQKGAALSGDSLARRAQSQMRDALNGLAANGLTLSSIGITTDHTTGNLVVDEKKLNAALTENRANVEQLFAGETGLSKRVTAAAEVFTKSDGLIKTSQDGIERTLKLLENQYDATQDRINEKMETYRRQFVQLDSFMAQMNGVSSYLTTQLSMLNNLSSSNKK